LLERSSCADVSCLCSCPACVSTVSQSVVACHWLGMASKDLCAVCEKPFYGKQKFTRCGECDSRFHCNCLQSDVSESNVIASTGKSAYKSENCKKQARDSTNGNPSILVIRRKCYPRRLSALFRVPGILILSACSWKGFAQMASIPWRWYGL
jgi:hypothetical protein